MKSATRDDGSRDMKDVIVLYAAPTSNCWRVSLVLEALELEYEVRTVDRGAGAQHSPVFRAINPTGVVLVIVDSAVDGEPLVLAQSGAILVYLAEKTGRLLAPAGTGRARQLQWLMHVLTDVNATSTALFHVRRAFGPDGDDAADLLRERLRVYLLDCCLPLRGSAFIAGEISLSDFALYPVVAVHRALVDADPQLAMLARWADSMAANAAVDRGMRAIRS